MQKELEKLNKRKKKAVAAALPFTSLVVEGCYRAITISTSLNMGLRSALM